MKHCLYFALVLLVISCKDSFINHTLAYEKRGDCVGELTPIKMTSNINGERYEFTGCLDANFDGKNYLVERKGDTLLVTFPSKGYEKRLFNLILDIDAKPAYRHIFLEGREVIVGRME